MYLPFHFPYVAAKWKGGEHLGVLTVFCGLTLWNCLGVTWMFSHLQIIIHQQQIPLCIKYTLGKPIGWAFNTFIFGGRSGDSVVPGIGFYIHHAHQIAILIGNMNEDLLTKFVKSKVGTETPDSEWFHLIVPCFTESIGWDSETYLRCDSRPPCIYTPSMSPSILPTPRCRWRPASVRKKLSVKTSWKTSRNWTKMVRATHVFSTYRENPRLQDYHHLHTMWGPQTIANSWCK